MSKYEADATKVTLERLDELTKRYKKIDDELTVLMNLSKSVESVITDLLEEIGEKSYNDVHLVEEERTLVDLSKLTLLFPNLTTYLIVEIKKEETLTIMAHEQLDYKVSERWLENAVSKSEFCSFKTKRLKIWKS